jgi:UDP-2-acetamido-3-amino-2,3-dideoxy-glucuronate N-acetyltransferase
MSANQSQLILKYYAHPKALVEAGAVIGVGTRIWAFAHVLPRALIGKECNICDGVFIENDVTLGNRVTIKCGVYLWDGLELDDDVFVGPGVVFANDLRPRSKKYPKTFLKTNLGKGSSIGGNATILPGIRIGRWAMVGAGSVVTKDVPAFALVVGNPARFVSWICRCGQKLTSDPNGRYSCQCKKKYRLVSKHELKETRQ